MQKLKVKLYELHVLYCNEVIYRFGGKNNAGLSLYFAIILK